MGNTQSGSIFTRTGGALDNFVSDLGSDIAYEKSLGNARFLKTVKCRHRNGYLVVKIFIKPDPTISLRSYHRRLKIERDALQDVVNAYSYQWFMETDRAGYIVRQWAASSLYDRISTRPFLTPVEKKWISFQVLSALRDARKRKVAHGDIKSENILVTSWNWVYLTDFAAYKPTYLPLDDPSDFAFYFDTSGQRNCYVAPERFYSADKSSEADTKKAKLRELMDAVRDGSSGVEGKVTEAMDVFSAGCVMAELFLDGAPLFNLSQLFKYRQGLLDVSTHLSAIEDNSIRDTIASMIDLNPEKRPSFDAILHTSRGKSFPEGFYTFLHDFSSSMNEPLTRFHFSKHTLTKELTAVNTGPQSGPSTILGATSHPSAMQYQVPESLTLPSESDRRIDKVYSEFAAIEAFLQSEGSVVSGLHAGEMMKQRRLSSYSMSGVGQGILPVRPHLPGHEINADGGEEYCYALPEHGSALIILSLVCTNLRNCLLPTSKLQALEVLLVLSDYLTDEAKLDRLVPYLVELLHDDAAIVRVSALRVLLHVVMLVTVITPFNAAIFPEYILPNLRQLLQDPDVSVRSMLALCIVPLAETAAAYLEMSRVLKAEDTTRLHRDKLQHDPISREAYDMFTEDLQEQFQEIITVLLVDQSSVVKRSMLHDVSSLCIFFGRQKTNDVLLGHMITYLNDRDWMLRYAFFENIVDVAACLGARSLEEYIIPLMMQSLYDVEEAVVARVLLSLTGICELGLFQKLRIWELMSATLPFLYHPNIWLNEGAAAFISSAAQLLPATDVWCILYPSLKHFLRSEITTLRLPDVLHTLKPPLSRPLYDASLEWAITVEKSQFWRSMRRGPTKLGFPKDVLHTLRRLGQPESRNAQPSSEDEMQFNKLQQLGMTPTDESKLLSLRDYLIKLAATVQSTRSRRYDEYDEALLQSTSDVELQRLSVPMHTIFLDTPLGELGQQLADKNVSANLIAPETRAIRQALSSDLPNVPVAEVRPRSPSESLVSETSSVNLYRRLHVGSADSQKAAPSIGSVRTNVAGHLETSSKLRQDISAYENSSTADERLSSDIKASYLTSVPTDILDRGANKLFEHLTSRLVTDAQVDFGPRVGGIPTHRRVSARSNAFAYDALSESVEGTLISHLSSHSDSINGLAVTSDHAFFVSCSDDKTVKVWDTARLERNVTSKPRFTYGQHHACVKCVCTLEGLHCFASAGDDGSLHVVRVHMGSHHTLPKYSKLQAIREYRMNSGEHITVMKHFYRDGISVLLTASSHCVIRCLDVNTMAVLQTMESPRYHGPIVSLCIGSNHTWLVSATLTGMFTLWDLRFGLPIRSWSLGSSSHSSLQIRQCMIHPTKGDGRWILIAIDPPVSSNNSLIQVEVWDIEKLVIVESFSSHGPLSLQPTMTREGSSVKTNVDRSTILEEFIVDHQDGANISSNLHSMRQGDGLAMTHGSLSAMTTGMHPFANSFIPPDGRNSASHAQQPGGYLIAGFQDSTIRLWNLEHPEQSMLLNSAQKYISQDQTAFNKQRPAVVAHHQQDIFKRHQNCISAIICVGYPFPRGIVSADHSGIIKVWRIEGL